MSAKPAMPIRIPSSELEKWRLAALLLMQEERGIVGYLADRHRDCLIAKDEAEAARWMDFTLKIEAIMDAGTKAAD